MTTNIRDPRSIVTPDAFQVSDEMLGLPLAAPGRRLAAMLIDLVVIALATAFVSGWGFFIWGMIGLVILQLAFQNPTGSWAKGNLGRVTSMAFRGSAGCLGVVILLGVGLVWFGTRSDLGRDQVEGALLELADVAAEGAGIDDARLENAESLEELAAILEDLESNPPGDAAVEIVADSSLFANAGLLSLPALIAEIEATEASTEEAVVVDGVTVPREVWSATLRARARLVFAGDTISALEESVARRGGEIVDLEERLAAAEAESERGLFPLLREIFSQLGSAFGVWTLYFTILTTLLRGRTVGKLMTRTRVLRLDGEPMTWFASLERAGGYAAGLATGLLGFMQVFWDRNRQCVHDRIVGTVVVRDGVAAVPGAWREVWNEAEEKRS